MDITYIYHSSFAVENENYILIFDFYKIPWIKNNTFSMNEIIDKDKTIIIFISHGHSDHFSSEIFKWDNGIRKIYYVISDDIDISDKKSNYYSIKEGDDIKIEDINVKAFGSSDLGVSFLIKMDDNTNIFHAGDLNWWKWSGETNEDQEYATNLFKRIVNDIKISTEEDKEQIDIAFFPVDPRLEENKYLGAMYFIENFAPKYLFPMHFWDKFAITKDFSEYIKNTSTKGVTINKGIENLNWR